ncbi:MAG: NAD-dependent epimerase/dehydratase family protein [bacterium]
MTHTALVTGASGFIGPYLIDRLVKDGWRVRAVSRRRPGFLDDARYREVEWRAADLTRPYVLDEPLRGVDRVYHVAGLFDFFATPEELVRANADATDFVCASARANRVPELVLFSTGAIYGFGYGNRAVRESDPPEPAEAYSRSKWEAEQRAFQHNGKDGLGVLVLRPGAVYGPGSVYGDAQALYLIKRGFLCGIPGLVDVGSSHIHAADCADAAHHLANRAESWRRDATSVDQLAFNLCDPTPTSNAALIRGAARAITGKGLVGVLPIRIPGFLLLLTAWLVETVARITRTRPMFETTGVRYLLTGHVLDGARLAASGYEFRYPDTLAGLAQTIRWYEGHGWKGFRRGEPVPSPFTEA